ncbi:MAG: hypothetical protein SFV54_19805 [Bryobacteraceae bacterium]|nr:hypothetical protein [Bryobacteraceae bacterium]
MSLRVDGVPSRWLQVGDRVGGNVVLEIEAAGGRATLADSDGATYSIILGQGSIGFGRSAGAATAPKLHRLSSLPPSEAEMARARATPTIVLDTYPEPARTIRTDDLDFAWIESDANPMKQQPVYPVGGEMLKWPSRTPEQKAEFLDLYRNCGWDMTVVTTNKGVSLRGKRIQRKP